MQRESGVGWGKDPVPDVAGRDLRPRIISGPGGGHAGRIVEEAGEEYVSLGPHVPHDPANPKDLVGDTKPPLHLVPPSVLVFLAEVMADGAKKYGPYNWREHPVKAHVYVAAALRHILAWFDGEDNAEDSGRNHLAHAAAGLGILLDAMATGNLVDDRPVPGAAGRLIQERAT